ncbi:MAG: succinate dehydrogenase, cytochrome b556 subunit [Actinomycetota bacterium]|nr:succinate dehydrogenase, cytochrome b556 subunit [Actinomycetota bacterium]
MDPAKDSADEPTQYGSYYKEPYSRTLYKGGGGMWSWILHRGSGLAVLGFLFLHILDTSAVKFGPKYYNALAKFYESPFFRPLEVVLMGLVIYHSFNGLRVILVDFWSKGSRYQTQLTRAVGIVSIVMFLPAAFFMLKPIFIK